MTEKYETGKFLVREQTGKVIKIVFTGGPCAGKTTAIPLCSELLLSAGFNVLLIPEGSTMIQGCGIVLKDNLVSNIEFQRALFKYQMFFEKLLSEINLNNDKDIVILCDRGLIDNKAYIEDKEEWLKLLKEFELTEELIFSSYDYILHMQSAAYGAEEAYTCQNNDKRVENTIEKARAVEDNIVRAYYGVDKNILQYIDNSTNFDEKIQRVVNALFEYLGLAKPTLKQRKFLVEKEEFVTIAKSYEANSTIIEQVYLKTSDKNIERKIRKVGKNGKYVYYYIVKHLDESVGIKQQQISSKLYDMLYNERDEKSAVLTKTRYYFSKDSIYYNLDVFENMKNSILEVRTTDKNNNIQFDVRGKFREVTNDERFKNSNIAKALKEKIDLASWY